MQCIHLLFLLIITVRAEPWIQNFKTSSSIDIVILLDRSSTASNYSAVTEKIVLNLISNLDYDKTRIGVIVYRTEPEVIFSDLKQRQPSKWCNLQKSLVEQRKAEGYSGLTQALEESEKLLLESKSSRKSVVLFTGSEANVGKSPFTRIFRLKSLVWTPKGGENSKNIEMHVMGFGDPSRIDVEAMVAPNQDRLRWFDTAEEMRNLAQALEYATPCATELLFPNQNLSSEDSVTSTVSTAPSNITVCAWVKPSQTNTHGTVFSYTKKKNQGRGNGNRANLMTLTNVGNLQVSSADKTFDTFIALTSDRWSHVCLSWSSAQWRMHVNSSLINESSFSRDTQRTYADATIELGQSARLPSGKINQSSSFHGSITQVQVFSRFLSQTDLETLSSPNTPCTHSEGDLVTWPEFLQTLKADSKIRKETSQIGRFFDWCPKIVDNCEQKCAINERCWNNNGRIICECDDQNARLCRSTYSKCDDSQCHGNGMCALDNDEKRCVCDYGYHGDRCQVTCSDCQNGGSCSAGAKSCRCKDRGYGRRCEVSFIPDCKFEPCYHGNGTCSLSDDAKGFQCQCSNKNLGPNCEATAKCDDSPCSEGATCINLDNGDSLCLNDATPTTTAAITKTQPPNKVPSQTYNVVLRLHGMEYSQKLQNDKQFHDTFTGHVKTMMDGQHSGPVVVTINDIRAGSVIVDFDIALYEPPDSQATSTMTSAAVQSMFLKELKDGKFGPYTAGQNDLVQVKKKDPAGWTMDETTMGAIIGGALGAVFLIIVCIGVTVHLRLKAQSKFEQMSHRTKPNIGYDLTELSSPIARSTPKPISPSPVSSFFRKWSTRGGQRSDTLQTLVNNPDKTLTREDHVISIEIHDNLGFIPDRDSSLKSESFRKEQVSLVTRPPPSSERENDALSLASSDTLKADDTAALDDSDFDSDSLNSGELDYNAELARSLKELDRVCSDENLNSEIEELKPPTGQFSLRREEIVTNIDDVELSDEADKNSPQSPISSEDSDKFVFLSHVIPNFEVIPTLELPSNAYIYPDSVCPSRTYSKQQEFILSSFQRQKLQYF